ncbi:C39 family peptidase [Candidatus Kaiserbacteria bacterium]|nr:C39 family peptidase [Candidatus Kaiserbacteria bacterium]MCB9812141.1 C39 family peptidase [Candidatus Nomurabacteria bacterium]
MIQWFLPIFVLIVELGVVYGITTAVSAFVAATPDDETPSAEVESAAPPKVAQLIVSPSPADITPAASTAETKTVRQRVPVKRVSAEEKAQQEAVSTAVTPARPLAATKSEIPNVPFYSQFTDISSASWQKVGCGIASLAMIIDHYAKGVESVDALLSRGIAADAFLSDAGWIHSGLIQLAAPYGLTGESVSYADLSMEAAFAVLQEELHTGPVMASVHYTFEPTNPIPHLVVVTGVQDGKVFYNDPAEASGGNSLSIEKFQRAWKKRFIAIRPV